LRRASTREENRKKAIVKQRIELVIGGKSAGKVQAPGTRIRSSQSNQEDKISENGICRDRNLAAGTQWLGGCARIPRQDHQVKRLNLPPS